MKLQDFRKNKKLVRCGVSYEGEEYEFHVKKISAMGHQDVQSSMMSVLADLPADILEKQEVQDDVDKLDTKAVGLKIMQSMKNPGDALKALAESGYRQVFWTVCDENGQPIFSSFDQMMMEYDSEFLDAILVEVKKAFPPVSTQAEAEKNSPALTG